MHKPGSNCAAFIFSKIPSDYVKEKWNHNENGMFQDDNQNQNKVVAILL